MRYIAAEGLATATLVLVTGLAPGATVLTAARTGQAPHIDGKLDDAAWAGGKPCTEFVINGTGAPPKLGTRAVVLFDDSALYIGVRCEEPDVGNLKTERMPRDSGDVFRCDCVEIMLDPTLSRNDYFHFGINASGIVADRSCTQGGFIGDMAWDAEVTAASFVGDTYWSCEVMVPFFSLGITPAVKSTWGINLCREKRRPEELSSIAANGAFNNAGGFAELRGLDVDFSRYCFEIGAPVTALQVRDGALDVDVSVPVRNASGQTRRALLDCWLISPSEQVVTASTVVDLPAGPAATYAVGRLTVRDQGDYACGIRVADPVTKKPLAYRGTRIPLTYVPLSIRLVEPWYRQAIFATQNLTQVVAEIDLRLDPAKTRGATLVVSTRQAGSAAPIETAQVPNPAGSSRVTLPAARLPFGHLELVAVLRDAAGKEVAQVVQPFRKLERKPGEVWLDRAGQWRVDGEPFFLNGAWNYPDDFVPDYNAFTAERPGVKFISCTPMNVPARLRATLREKKLDPELETLLRQLVRAERDKPHLFAYYLADEPECMSATASALEAAYQVLCDEDPYHPAILSNDSLSGLKDYARCGDINGLHPYPAVFKDKRVNDMKEVATFVESATAFFHDAAHRQTIAYLHQGFNYGDYGAVNNRVPNYLEYRNQDLLALICGANGFIQFNRMVAHYPELYLGMPHLTKEFAYLGRAILAPTSAVTVTSSAPQFRTLLKDTGSELVLLAGNADGTPREATLTVPGLGQRAKQLQVVSEGRTVPVTGDVVRDRFDSWEVHVYTTAVAAADLATVQEICRQIDAANARRRKPGNLAFQMYEGDGVTLRASSNKAGSRRPENALWHVVDGVVDKTDHYHCLTWQDDTPNAGPDWIEIELPQPQPLGRVVVYPFEKSLRDYAVQVWTGNAWQEVATVTARTDEQIEHRFPPVTAAKVRLWVTATNGPNALVTEAELYAK